MPDSCRQRGPLTRRALLRGAAGALTTTAIARGEVLPAQEQFPGTPAPLGPAIPPEIAQETDGWPTAQGNLAGHRASGNSALSAASIDRLEIAWRLPLTAESGYGAATATPIVIGDTVYIQDMASNVFAIDRESGTLRWRRDYGRPTAGGNGVAVGYGLVFGVIGIGAEVFALRADSGDEVWLTRLSANPGEFLFIQPLVYDSVVYAATSPGAYLGGTRGIFFALDAASGAVLWQWDTTVDNLWGNARLNAGGGVWYPPSVDERGNLYFGTGNPAPWPEPDPSQSTRPGPNLYTSSMVSLDPVSGALRWYVQAAAHDQLDHDFQLTPMLADIEIDGAVRRLAIGGGKTGTVIAAERDSGAVIWEASVGEHNAYGDGAESPVPSATPVTVAPGFFGGVLTPMAFAQETVFVPVINLPLVYTDTSSEFDLATATGEMIALRASDASVRWRTEVETFFSGGATMANDVVFGAGLDGMVRAFDCTTGEERWRFQADAGVNAAPAIAGDMLFVLAGAGLIGGRGAAAKAELLAFRLDGADSGATPVASPLASRGGPDTMTGASPPQG